MKELTSEQLKRKLEAGEKIAVVDIREPDEFEDWHIAGSTNVPVYDALGEGRDEALEKRRDQLPTDRPIVAVCRTGYTSRRAVELMDEWGLDAANLAGGIRDWSLVHSESRLPLNTAPKAVFIQVRRNGKGCLSYIAGTPGEPAGFVVDPSVSPDVYLDIAGREGIRITHVLETHVHADHLSRARELSRLTGAGLYMPENRRVTFEYRPLRHGDELGIGAIHLEVIATPGHTGESASYVINGEALLTGDTLFVDSIGRPDLEKGDEGAEAGADALFSSLHERLLTLNDIIHVYPAHTGSQIGFDGKPITATLGEVRNRIGLLSADRATFTSNVLAGLTAKPPSFHEIIAVNEGRRDLGGINPLNLEAGPNRCAVKSAG